MNPLKLPLSALALVGLIAVQLNGEDKLPQNIKLKTIDGRAWLVDSHGKPFFAHGITHLNTNRAKLGCCCGQGL